MKNIDRQRRNSPGFQPGEFFAKQMAKRGKSGRMLDNFGGLPIALAANKMDNRNRKREQMGKTTKVAVGICAFCQNINKWKKVLEGSPICGIIKHRVAIGKFWNGLGIKRAKRTKDSKPQLSHINLIEKG